MSLQLTQHVQAFGCLRLLCGLSSFLPCVLGLLKVVSGRIRRGTSCPAALLCPLLTSAYPSVHLPVFVAPPGADMQTSPGKVRKLSHLCPSHIRLCFPYRYRTLKIFAFLSSIAASYVISVRQASALPSASFRFHLTMDTLAVRLTFPPVGYVRDFHPRARARAGRTSGRRGRVIAPVLPHHRTYGSVYGGSVI